MCTIFSIKNYLKKLVNNVYIYYKKNDSYEGIIHDITWSITHS